MPGGAQSPHLGPERPHLQAEPTHPASRIIWLRWWKSQRDFTQNWWLHKETTLILVILIIKPDNFFFYSLSSSPQVPSQLWELSNKLNPCTGFLPRTVIMPSPMSQPLHLSLLPTYTSIHGKSLNFWFTHPDFFHSFWFSIHASTAIFFLIPKGIWRNWRLFLFYIPMIDLTVIKY